MGYLELRTKEYQRITCDLKGLVRYLTPLCALIKIDDKISRRLIQASNLFAERSREYSFLNRTPNGFLVPKIETQKEFLDVLLRYRDLLIDIGLGPHILSLTPPVVRYKIGSLSVEDENRVTRSEYPHNDAWAGWPANCMIPIIPVSGDCENNKVVVYDMPNDLSPDWLDKIPFPQAQLKFVHKCQEIKADYRPGFMFLLDICVVHRTHRHMNAGDRIGIDSPIVINNNLVKNLNDNNNFGQESLIVWSDFLKIGHELYFNANTNMQTISGISGVKRPEFFEIGYSK